MSDDLAFLGWWVEPKDVGPPAYGVFQGTLEPQSDLLRFSTAEMVSLHLPRDAQSITQFSMTQPQEGESQLGFDGAPPEPMRADPRAHAALSMAQRSGRYAGELQLSGRREPVSLQWAADGTITMSLTRLAGNGCSARAQASPMPGAPDRLLAFTMTFAGTECPELDGRLDANGNSLPSVPLNGMSINGAIDASSADAFVLFGSNDLVQRPLVLPAHRAPAPTLQGAWTGISTPHTEFHLAILDDLSFLGWQQVPAGDGSPIYGLTWGTLEQPSPDASHFASASMQIAWAEPNYQLQSEFGFGGPLPVSDSMRGAFIYSANMHFSPIAGQALPMAQRSGQYQGALQLPGLRLPADLVWGTDGGLSLSLRDWPSCAGSGQAESLPGGPARWLSVQMSFGGSACPTTDNGVNLSGIAVRGAVDAASGDRFVLFGIDDARLVPVVLPSTRMP